MLLHFEIRNKIGKNTKKSQFTQSHNHCNEKRMEKSSKKFCLIHKENVYKIES